MPMKTEICNYCLRSYTGYTCRSKYCSEGCRKAAARLRQRQQDNPANQPSQHYQQGTSHDPHQKSSSKYQH